MGASCHACIGGTNVRNEMQKLQAEAPHIVVGTPGRVFDMLNRRFLCKSASRRLLNKQTNVLLDWVWNDGVPSFGTDMSWRSFLTLLIISLSSMMHWCIDWLIFFFLQDLFNNPFFFFVYIVAPKWIKMFVLDEADEMLSRGFKDQIYEIFQKLSTNIQVSWVLSSSTRNPGVELDLIQPLYMCISKPRSPPWWTSCVLFCFFPSIPKELCLNDRIQVFWFLW